MELEVLSRNNLHRSNSYDQQSHSHSERFFSPTSLVTPDSPKSLSSSFSLPSWLLLSPLTHKLLLPPPMTERRSYPDLSSASVISPEKKISLLIRVVLSRAAPACQVWRQENVCSLVLFTKVQGFASCHRQQYLGISLPWELRILQQKQISPVSRIIFVLRADHKKGFLWTMKSFEFFQFMVVERVDRP